MGQEQDPQAWRKRNSILAAAQRTDTVLPGIEFLQGQLLSTTGLLPQGKERLETGNFSQQHYLMATARTCLYVVSPRRTFSMPS